MKITDVQAYLLAIPLKDVDFPAPWVWGAFNQIMVEIMTDEGITGYGEAFGYGEIMPLPCFLEGKQPVPRCENVWGIGDRNRP